MNGHNRKTMTDLLEFAKLVIDPKDTRDGVSPFASTFRASFVARVDQGAIDGDRDLNHRIYKSIERLIGAIKDANSDDDALRADLASLVSEATARLEQPRSLVAKAVGGITKEDAKAIFAAFAQVSEKLSTASEPGPFSSGRFPGEQEMGTTQTSFPAVEILDVPSRHYKRYRNAIEAAMHARKRRVEIEE